MPTPRTPSHLKKLRATFKPTQDPGEGITAEGALKTAPKHLSQRQREIWKHAITVAPPALLKRCDRDLLAAWVTTVDRHREANRKLPLLADPDDIARTHKVMNDTARLMVVLGQQIGFSPSSRQRIKPEAPKQDRDPEDVWSVLRLVPRTDPEKTD